MSKFNMTENEYNSAQRSYDRTSQLVDEGIAKSQEYLSQQKQAREAAYLAAVQNAA